MSEMGYLDSLAIQVFVCGETPNADLQPGCRVCRPTQTNGLFYFGAIILMEKTSGILDSSQQAIQNATRATANLDSISAKIDRGQGTAGALVNDKQLYSNLEKTTSAMRDTMAQAQAGVADFHDNMEALKHNVLLRGYFKSRGYENPSELAKNEIERLPQGTPTKMFTYPVNERYGDFSPT